MQDTIRADLPLSKMAGSHVRTRTVTASTSVMDADGVVYVNASGGSVTITLPAAANRAGKAFTLFRTDATPNMCVTVYTVLAGYTIDVASSSVRNGQYASATFQSY